MYQYVSALEAWEKLNSSGNFVLVDTRTSEEWKNIGTPDISNKIFRISSHLLPDMNLNEDFAADLVSNIKDKTTNIIFICRTNGRSRIACDIASKIGYENCYVVIDGFEGNAQGDGWKNSNLPYIKL